MQDICLKFILWVFSASLSCPSLLTILSAFSLSIDHYSECHYSKCHYAECRYSEGTSQDATLSMFGVSRGRSDLQIQIFEVMTSFVASTIQTTRWSCLFHQKLPFLPRCM